MKKILSVLISAVIIISFMPSVFALGETLTLTSNVPKIGNIEDVKISVSGGAATLDSVTVNGVNVPVYTFTDGILTFDASDYAGLGNAIINVSSGGKSGSITIDLERFIDYSGANAFLYGGRVGDNVITFDEHPWFGWYGLTQSESSYVGCVITDGAIKCTSKNTNATNSDTWVRMPKLSTLLGVGDNAARYAVLDFFSDIKTATTNSRLNLFDVGGFSIGTDIFSTNGKFSVSDISYAADTWYTMRAHIDTINGVFKVYVKERDTQGAEEQEIYSRTEELLGPNFKQFGFTAYGTTDAVYTIDNLYQQGYVVQPGASNFRYVSKGTDTPISGNVPANFNSLKVTIDCATLSNAAGNVYFKDSEGNRINASAEAVDAAGSVKAYITATPQEALAEGSYTLVLGAGLTIDNVPTVHDRNLAFTVEATEFSLMSPKEGDKVCKGEAMALGAAAPGASAVQFIINGATVNCSRVGTGNTFTGTYETAALPVGAVPCEVMAFSADGALTAYDKVFFNVTDKAITNVVAAKNWVQISGGDTDGSDKNGERIQSPFEANGQVNGWRLFYAAANKAPTDAYLWQNTTMDTGYSGKVIMSMDIMAETETDKVNVYAYVNTSAYDLSTSGRTGITLFEGLFNSNGCFCSTSVPYTKGTWYQIKAVLDLENNKKQLYVGNNLIAEGALGGEYLCIGFFRIKLIQTSLQDRTEYAAVSVDNIAVDSEVELSLADSFTCDSEAVTENRIIPESAENVTVVLNKPVTNATGIKAYINGELSDITPTLSAPVLLSDGSTVAGYEAVSFNVKNKIGSGDKLNLRFEEGTGILSALKAAGAVTSAITAALPMDVNYELTVGDADKVYYEFSEITLGERAETILRIVNESGNEMPVVMFAAAYSNGGKRVDNISNVVTTVDTGEKMFKLSVLPRATSDMVKAFLWTEDLKPMAAVTKNIE